MYRRRKKAPPMQASTCSRATGRQHWPSQRRLPAAPLQLLLPLPQTAVTTTNKT